MHNRLEERNLRLTEEEAMGLLEIAMTCPVDLSSEQRAAIVKLGEFCRQFMRADAGSQLADKAAELKDTILPVACAA